MKKEKLMILLSVMVVGAMLFASLAMLPAAGQAKATSTLMAANPGVTAVPGAPQDLVADQGPGFVWLWWDHPLTNGDQLIKKYEIWRGTSQGGEAFLDWVYVGAHEDNNSVDLGTINFYNDTMVDLDTTYWYEIKAVSDTGSSAASNEVSATPSMTGDAPGAPTPATATNLVYQAQVNWTVPDDQGSTPVRYYFLYRDPGYSFYGYDFPVTEEWLRTTGFTDDFGYYELVVGQQYNYTIRAVNSYGEGQIAYANATVGGTGSTPTAPENLWGIAFNKTAELWWSHPDNPSEIGFDGYNVYRSLDYGGPYDEIGNYTYLAKYYGGFFEDEGLTNGQTYHYKVAAFNANGEGQFSNIVNVTPMADPTSLAISYLYAYPGNHKVLLEWGYAYNHTGYTIYRSESSGTETFLVNASGQSYIDDTAVNGHNYYYVVKAVRGSTIGPASPEANATASTGPVPDAPILAGTPDSYGAYLYSPPIEVTSPIIGWTVYRGTVAGGEGPVSVYNWTGVSFLTFFDWADSSAIADVNYYYTVKAENLYGVSPESNEASTFMSPTGDVPDPVTVIGAAPVTGGIQVTWDSPTYEGTATLLYYDVWRSSGTSGWQIIKYEVTDLAGTTQWTDTTVTPGVTYTYKVFAYNQYGDSSDFSPDASATAAGGNVAPSAPRNLAAQSGAGFVKLTWQAPTNMGTPALTGYNVYRGTASGGEVLLTTVTGLTYNDTTGTVGTPYWYYVKAVNSVGPGPASNEVTGTSTPLPSVPGAPQNLVAVGHNGYVILNWQAPAAPGNPAFTKYSVWRGASVGSLALIANVTAPTLSYNDSAVTNGQTYVYAVKAVNTVGSSDPSNTPSATPSVTGTAPGAPTDLSATGLKNKISLTWTAPANPGSGVSNYLVYRGTTAGGEGTTAIATVTGTVYMDTTAVPGTPYFYVVEASNTYGVSPISNEANATALAATAPSAPQSLTATAGPSKVTLTWTAPTDDGGTTLLGYRVYRSSAGGAYAQVGSDLSASTLSYVDTTGTVGTTYSYYVVAFNPVGAGAHSNAQSAASESGGGTTDNTMLYAGIGIVVVIIVIILIAWWYMRSKNKSPPQTP